MQADFNDARVQAGVQKVAQAQENTRQHAPINARRAEQCDAKSHACCDGLNACNAPQLDKGHGLNEAGNRQDHNGGQHGTRHVKKRW